ncbi:HLH domain containing protein [Trichuris trichiura]|uniref:HLH domain containing protein n=1 Tax=Trichuris trichiura TaxID=36087 RepID=A0A077YVG8_TRITR|nr:HLH domain containing protein [Trichuris trichiura]
MEHSSTDRFTVAEGHFTFAGQFKEKKCSTHSAKKSKTETTADKLTIAVACRNARERRRVHKVNEAFDALKSCLPTLKQRTRRVSKLKILRSAIEYIKCLQSCLPEEASAQLSPAFNSTNCLNVENRSDSSHYFAVYYKQQPTSYWNTACTLNLHSLRIYLQIDTLFTAYVYLKPFI